MFELLDKHHDRQAFDCGNQAINRYLQTMANQHAKKNITKTHILADGSTIKAFYTLSVNRFDNHQKTIGGYPNEIPIVIIGRIGVNRHHKGKGLSKLAIAHALQIIKRASFDMGIAFVMINAKDEQLAQYYERLGFIRLMDSLSLIYPVHQI